MKVRAKGTAGDPRGRKPYYDSETEACILAVKRGYEVVCDHIVIKASGSKVIQNKGKWRVRIASMCQQLGKPMVSVYWTEADEDGKIVPVISR
jgi:hypothetical protein